MATYAGMFKFALDGRRPAGLELQLPELNQNFYIGTRLGETGSPFLIQVQKGTNASFSVRWTGMAGITIQASSRSR